MSTSVLVNGIASSLPVPTGGSHVTRLAAQPPPPVLQDRRDDEHRDDRTGRQAHRDRVAEHEQALGGEPQEGLPPERAPAEGERVPQERLEVRRTLPAERLLR